MLLFGAHVVSSDERFFVLCVFVGLPLAAGSALAAFIGTRASLKHYAFADEKYFCARNDLKIWRMPVTEKAEKTGNTRMGHCILFESVLFWDTLKRASNAFEQCSLHCSTHFKRTIRLAA